MGDSDSTASEYKFEGWGCFDKDSVEGKMKWFEYEPKSFCDDDVDIKIQYCGICGSDLHVAGSGWGDMTGMYPLVVGHEIVGEVVRVGKDVRHLKVGDVGGVGAQCDSCGVCDPCKINEEQYCDQGVTHTYGGIFLRSSKGEKTNGGYANYWRGPAHFVIPIPANMDPAIAAPMMCAASCVYSPLLQYGAGKTAKEVGVVGVGAVGHYAILFAKAMGANVTAITHSPSKVEDAKKLGASKVIVTQGLEKGGFVWGGSAWKEHQRILDLIICSSSEAAMPLSEYMHLLRPHGTICLVGAPEADSLPKVHPHAFIFGNYHLSGSAISSPRGIAAMLEFAAEHDIQPWIQKYSMDDANKAFQDMHHGKARYKIVLVNEKNGGRMDPVGARI